MKIFRVNQRGQISLGKIAEYEHYVASVDPETKEIRLIPVVIAAAVKREVDPGATQA